METTNYVSYKIQNFVSDIGGLVGLFLGISFLSLFELAVKAFGFLKKIGNRITSSKRNRKRPRKSRKSKNQMMNSNLPDLIAIGQLFGETIKNSNRFGRKTYN